METMAEVGLRLGDGAVELRGTLLRTVGRAREGMRKGKRAKSVRRVSIFDDGCCGDGWSGL